MKKYLLLLTCLTLAASASAWGLLEDLVSFNGDPYIYKKSFLYYVLTSKNPKIRVCVSTEGTSTDPARQKITRDYFLQSTQSALDNWLSFVRTQLGERQPVRATPAKGKKKAKKQQTSAVAPEFARKDEFADILEALPRRIELQVINPNGEDCDKVMKGKYDLRIKSLGNLKYGSVLQQLSHTRGMAASIKGVYDKDPTIWRLSLPGNDDYTASELAEQEAMRTTGIFVSAYALDYNMDRVARHEMGHFFGLADQYEDKKNMNKVRSLLRTEPGEVVFGGLPSVMAKSATLTCDDLEGFINAVDFIWGMEGKNSPRVQNGWKSLCGKPYTYLQGIPVKDSADMSKVQAYLKHWKQSAVQLGQLAQLGQEWRAYLEKVRKMEEEYVDALYTKRQQMRGGLDKAGLALSAESRYLTQKAAKIKDIIEQQIAPAEEAARAGNISAQQIRQLVQNLSQYKGQYTPESKVLDAKGLLTAQPYEDDFSPITYPCLVCGKPVGLENGYLSQDVKVLGRIRPYHIHSACEAKASAYYSKLGNTYRHKATKRTVPTWTQLTQSQEANPLLAQLETDFMPAKKTVPVVLDNLDAKKGSGVAPRKNPLVASLPTKPAGATPKRATPSSTPKNSKPVSNGQNAAPVKQKAEPAKPVASPVQTPVIAPKAKCVVCGQEMADGTFYTDSVGRTVHKHSLCAYRFFKRFHKTDEDSLTRYSDYYFFSMPNDVVQAKADMRKLDLTFADIRRYHAQEEAAAEDFKKSLEAEKLAKAQAQAKAEKCRLVIQVTPADVQAYEKENKAVLARVAQKEAGGRPLTKKETLVKRHYAQLKDNLALTEECKD
ncbi:MAG: hypothetical protein EGQ14_02265 [Spirochaetia bacterium]|uniref:hypothetical protein n=1 Tax=Candidatus Avelusimicrobium fimicolum TaxID=3416216 RepID=UPI003C8A719B|nr:hypothetical protein [Spirochaetia bacterium]